MSDSPPGSQQAIRQLFPAVIDAYSGLRRALDGTGPLDRRTRELILLAGFTVGRAEGSYKAHCRMALEAGATPEEVRQATVITLGANCPIEYVADGLNWAEEVIASRQQAAP
jgi:alkylhydroperoxidase/carboxymuconolactone decarboxylase family protein YurZ